MNKKNYIIIGSAILFFVIAIAVILIIGNKKTDWTSDIREAQKYQMIIKNCNGREKELDKNLLDELSSKWNSLINNGPWTGDENACYTTLTISYETNGVVKRKQITIIDDTSLVLDLNTQTIYYTNGQEIINYLNSLLNA